MPRLQLLSMLRFGMTLSVLFLALPAAHAQNGGVDSGAMLPRASSTIALKPAPDFTRLVKTYGGAVVNIGVAREGGLRREGNVLRQDRVDESTLGSGFIVGTDGYILTNAHVVARGASISVKLSDRREFKAQLVGLDVLADVALLKIEASGLPVIKIGDPARVEVGEWVLAIGAPYGFSNSVTAGIVSAKGRTLPGADYMPFLQTDVPINPGNSGGPLFNMRGEVIGINSRIYSNSGGYQGLSFAIPIDAAMRIKNQLQSKGSVTRGRIGIAVQEVSQALAQSFGLPKPVGALVSYVEPHGGADRAGLRSADVILRIDQQEVIQSADALIYIASLMPGQRVAAQVWRNRAMKSVDMSIDAFEVQAPPLERATGVQVPLGMAVRSLSLQEGLILQIDGGLMVERVNVVAERSGVRAGDVILTLNGRPIANVESLQEAIRLSSGAAALLIQRGSNRLFVAIELP